MTVGERIKQIREELGISQEELAIKIGLKVRHKQRIFKGLQAGCHIGCHTCVIYRTVKQ